MLIYALAISFYAMEFVQLSTINKLGLMSVYLELGVCISQIFRATLVFNFLLLGSLGFKINKPNLSGKSKLLVNSQLLSLFLIYSLYVACKEKLDTQEHSL